MYLFVWPATAPVFIPAPVTAPAPVVIEKKEDIKVVETITAKVTLPVVTILETQTAPAELTTQKRETSPGEEIIDVIPQEYIVDGSPEIKEPIGMAGVRLEANFHIITGHVSNVTNIRTCVERSDLSISAIVLEPIASANAVLSDEEKEAGVWLIRTATVIPDNERWLHEAQPASELARALAWSKQHPAADDQTDALLGAADNTV